MQRYYKNSELAKIYGVSRQSVSKWIESVRNGKLHLEMIAVNGQSYICNTPKNNKAIEAMVHERKKYFNTRSLKTVTPKDAFYKLYMPEQIADIISSIRIHKEIPRQYNYFDEGAQYWDKYSTQLFNDVEGANPIHSTEILLQTSFDYLDKLLSKHTRVNIVDIGPGNALPVKSLLSHLLKKGIFGRYTAIDISPDMLEIARRNIKKWFGSRVDFEADLRDINFERFTDLMGSSPDDGSVNLVIFFGGTLHNLRSPNEVLRTIYNSMAPPDLLICPLKLDTEATRQHFHFVDGATIQPLPPQYKFLVDMLGIDPSFYEVEMGFDEKIKARYLQIKLKFALSIRFQFNGVERVVSLNKDDRLLVWRYWHQSAMEIYSQFERNGFGVLQSTQTEQHDCVLTICDIKTEG
ncbi:MAG TPA: L-histidine N(alpha)-methyltransferase [Candidatus Saccharimonadales bacterium]|nr:L-histidine N(alpha)-methyltransferase [Candidatus Saccharimonadales bacterium]